MRFQRGGLDVAIPSNIDSAFDAEDRPLMHFTVSGVVLQCHFFTAAVIEFSFDPEQVTEETLRDLLAFMVDLGDATSKAVIMTPENCPESPIFRYDAEQQQLRWLAAK